MNPLPHPKLAPQLFCPTDTQKALKNNTLPLPLAFETQISVFSFTPQTSQHLSNYRKKLAQKIQAFVL